MAKITAICVSEKRGLQKHPIDVATFVIDHGIEGDAHAANWHRQVSLLSKQDIDDFKARGAELYDGCFGENLIIDGIDVSHLPVQTRLKIGDVVLEVTQHGKECHTHCQIFHKMGECIMPVKGTFTKVVKGGVVHKGDKIEMIEKSEKLTAAVITLSDRCFKGETQDLSGPLLKEELERAGFEIAETILIPDNKELLKAALIRLCDQRDVSLVLTTGGTGFSPKDITPEVTLEVIEKQAPGISEAIRAESLKFTKHAMLSRGVSGIRKQSLIVNLPGSPKACKESLDVFLEPCKHGLRLLKGEKVDK